MAYIVICTTAFFISIVTLFSGFGLGTVLMPVFALFFSLPTAIIATAGVHFLNNIFKVWMVGHYADKKTVVKFGLPAAVAALLGAYLFVGLGDISPLLSYQVFSYPFAITWIGLIIGSIIFLSAFFELILHLSHLSFRKDYLVIGGLLSGLFGGLSGQQGVLRSAFLIKSGLDKEQFIGTSVVCGIIVDAVRLIVYGWSIASQEWVSLSKESIWLVTAASCAAFLGTYVGSKYMTKITFRAVQLIVGNMLMLIGLGMILGIIH